MKIKHKDAIHMYEALEKLSTVDDFSVAFRISLNKRKLQTVVDLLTEIQKPGEKWFEYEQKRIDICSKHCLKEENGSPIISANNTFQIDPEKVKEFEQDIIKLREEFAEVLKKEEERSQKLPAFLQEETDIDIQKIKLDDLTKAIKSIDPKVVDSILDMIEL